MIHSMSGGVLGERASYTFAKAIFDGEEQSYWFIAEFEVVEGDRVLAPRAPSGLGFPATITKVEHNVSGQVSPIPVKRVKKLIGKL